MLKAPYHLYVPLRCVIPNTSACFFTWGYLVSLYMPVGYGLGSERLMRNYRRNFVCQIPWWQWVTLQVEQTWHLRNSGGMLVPSWKVAETCHCCCSSSTAVTCLPKTTHADHVSFRGEKNDGTVQLANSLRWKLSEHLHCLVTAQNYSRQFYEATILACDSSAGSSFLDGSIWLCNLLH